LLKKIDGTGDHINWNKPVLQRQRMFRIELE
jgi:hypothetical protein